jgi:CMP-N-acetylneuraminic acid synthetase
VITAVVPVRKGSQRVKNKNIRPFAGSNLLKIKLDILMSVGLFDEIVVSTDSIEMSNIASQAGVRVHKRDPYYASSECNNSEFFENIAKSIESDVIAYTPVTSPLVSCVLDEIESVDIDTELDFLVAETLYKKLYGLAGEENEI